MRMLQRLTSGTEQCNNVVGEIIVATYAAICMIFYRRLLYCVNKVFTFWHVLYLLRCFLKTWMKSRPTPIVIWNTPCLENALQKVWTLYSKLHDIQCQHGWWGPATLPNGAIVAADKTSSLIPPLQKIAVHFLAYSDFSYSTSRLSDVSYAPTQHIDTMV